MRPVRPVNSAANPSSSANRPEHCSRPAAGAKFATYVKGLGHGGRAGPLKLKLAGGAEAVLSLCHLPLNGDNISCTLSKPGPKSRFGGDGKDAKTGLSTAMHLFPLPQRSPLTPMRSRSSKSRAFPMRLRNFRRQQVKRFLSRIGQMIRQTGVKEAGRISASTFGAVAGIGARNKVGQAVREALAEGGLGSLQVEETLISLKAQGLSEDQRMLALRYVTDRLSKRRPGEKLPIDLDTAFEGMVRETEARALKLTETVAEGAFESCLPAHRETGEPRNLPLRGALPFLAKPEHCRDNSVRRSAGTLPMPSMPPPPSR